METLRTKLEDVRQSAIGRIKELVKPGESVTLSNEVNAVYCDCVAEVAVADHIKAVERSDSGDTLYAVCSNKDTCDLSSYTTDSIIDLCEEVANSRTKAIIHHIKESIGGKPYEFPVAEEPTWQDEYNGNMYCCVHIKPCEVTDEFPHGLQFEVNVKGDDKDWGLWGELPVETLRFVSERLADKISSEKIERINELLDGNIHISFFIPREEKVTWTDPNNGEEVQCDCVSAANGKIDLMVFETRNNNNFGHLDTAPIEVLDKIIAIIEKYALAYKRLMNFTDEQKQAFNEFIAARNKLKELGVVIFRDETNCVDYIFNGNNFDDIDAFCSKEDETDPRKLDITYALDWFEYGKLCDIAFNTDGYSFYGRLKDGVSI